MTRKVFWEDPYLTEIEAEITGVDGAAVTVDRTVFFAEAGGQESDRGTINGQPVLQARKAGQEIIYVLDANHGLRVGDLVRMEIDWERRYRLMRLHFAAETILELTYRKLPGIEKIGAHIAQDKARIDFKWDGNISDIFPELEKEARELVAANSPIISAFSDEAAGRRYWLVEGFAEVPCGGTHLRQTGEIGRLRLKRNNIGKGKERVEIYLDDE